VAVKEEEMMETMSTRVNESVNWHQVDPRELVEILQSSDGGLPSEEALRRFERYGPNELIEKGLQRHSSVGLCK
jgi:hypothetical protein